MLTQTGSYWRRAHARRLAFLIDADAYFAAFAAAAERAEHSIIIVAWDVHTQAPLPSRGTTLGAFLDDLTRRRPALRVDVLDWDYAFIYALERELLPTLRFGWNGNGRIRFVLDGAHPPGASHHQKLVVIDDQVAFVGGLDLTVHRWDTPAHRDGDPGRVLPDGTPYPPFHDVQVAVEGEAAAALGELARTRWQRAAGACDPPPRAARSPWPEELRADLRDVDVLLARTQPAHDGAPEIREVEQSYLDAIAGARRAIYIENQYFTATRLGAALAARLREADGPEVVLVTNITCSGWLEEGTMGALRAQLVRRLRAADHAGRFRIYCPQVPAARADAPPVPVTVHGKVLIVDDRLARIGSANFNNRSTGLDSECDLILEADDDATTAQVIGGLRDRLLGEHLGLPAAAVAAAVAAHGSLSAAIEALAGGPRRLAPLDCDQEPWSEVAVSAAMLADPERPIPPAELARLLVPEPLVEHRRPWLRLTALAVPPLALAALWHWTPLGQWADTSTLGAALHAWGEHPLGLLWVLLAYLLGGLVAFPLLLLIPATLLAFGVTTGALYALIGALASAMLLFAIGHAVGRHALVRWLGPRGRRIAQRLVGVRGIAAVAMVRLVPLAPFSLVNLFAGALGLPFRDYVIGTALGLTPGVLVMSAAIAGFSGVVEVAAAAGILAAAGALGVLLAWALRRLRRVLPRLVRPPAAATQPRLGG